MLAPSRPLGVGNQRGVGCAKASCRAMTASPRHRVAKHPQPARALRAGERYSHDPCSLCDGGDRHVRCPALISYVHARGSGWASDLGRRCGACDRRVVSGCGSIRVASEAWSRGLRGARRRGRRVLARPGVEVPRSRHRQPGRPAGLRCRESGGVSTFDRRAVSGALRQKPGFDGCISQTVRLRNSVPARARDARADRSGDQPGRPPCVRRRVGQ